MTPAIRIVDVHQTFGSDRRTVHAVRGISLDVEAGEFVAITGRSGSGKSSLLLMAGGLSIPTSGTTEIAGQSTQNLNQRQLAALRRKHVGFVFQDLNLVPSLTAAENVSLPLELDGYATRPSIEAALVALAEVGIIDLADAFPDEISGGEQQRVAIARALVGGRNIVLADEPTGALDEMTGEGINRILRGRADAGNAVVVVTHDPSQAAWADRVVRLRDGAIDNITARSSAGSIQ